MTVHPAKTQISLDIRPVWLEPSLYAQWVEAQADLSLRFAHMPFCWFCREAALSLFSVQDTVNHFIFAYSLFRGFVIENLFADI